MITPDEVRATATDGLVLQLHAFTTRAPLWFVVHEESGQRLKAWRRPERGDELGRVLELAYVDVERARAVADALDGLADWTAPADELHAAVGADVIELLYRIGDAAEGVRA